MKLYSYQGQEPKRLPERIRLENGTTITNLNKLTHEELISYGFSGPFEVPIIDRTKQELTWNGEEYVITDIPESTIQQRIIEEQRELSKNIDHKQLVKLFKSTSFNYRLRKESSNHLKVNTLYVELITHLRFNQDIDEIFELLNKIFYLISFTEEEIQSLQRCLSDFNLTYLIPDLSSNQYDFDTDSIVNVLQKPFESWIWNGSKWTAPISYPIDGKSYVWNETTKKWKKI